MPIKKEIKINQFLSIKLVKKKINLFIYNREEDFESYSKLLIKPLEELNQKLDLFISISEAVNLKNILYLNRRTDSRKELPIDPEQEFKNISFNLKRWIESGYKKKLFNPVCVFHLLRKLTKAGDRRAKIIYKKELTSNLGSSNYERIRYIIGNNYLKDFRQEEIEDIFKNIKNLDIEKVMNLREYDDWEYERIENLIKIFSISSLDKYEFINRYKKDLVKEIINHIHSEGFSWYLNILLENADKKFKSLLSTQLTKILQKDPYKGEILIELIASGCLSIFSRKQLESIRIKEVDFNNDNLSYYYEDPLEKLPKEFGYIVSLEKINIDYEIGIKELPESIKNLKNLRILDLLGADSLETLPKTILKLKNLKTVILPYHKPNLEIFKPVFELNQLKELFIKIYSNGESYKFNLIKYKSVLNSEELLNYANVLYRLKEWGWNKPQKFPYEFFDMFLEKLAITNSDEKIKNQIEEILRYNFKIYYSFIYDFCHGSFYESRKFLEYLIEHYGTSLSWFFKKLIREKLETDTYEKVMEIISKRWFYMISESDLKDLIHDPDIEVIKKLIENIKESYEREILGTKLEKLFFKEILKKLSEKEVKALLDLQNILSDQINIFHKTYYDEDMMKPMVKIQDNHVIELYLSNCDLKKLPSSIGSLKKLKHLFLSNNELKDLPESVGGLKNLTKLFIDNNKLKKLPDSIGDLESLESLVYHGNNLSELPISIWRSTKIDTNQCQFFDTPGFEETALSKIYQYWFNSKGRNKQNGIPSFEEAFKNYLGKFELKSIAKRLRDLVKFKIRLDLMDMKFYDANEPKASKFRGSPDVPKNFKWPYWNGRSLDFLLQINLKDINHFKYNKIPYKNGLIYVFFDTYAQPSGYQLENKGAWRVIYSNEHELIRMNNPEKKGPSRPNTGQLGFFKDFSLPNPWTDEMKQILINKRDMNNYIKFYLELVHLDFEETSHWMYGYTLEVNEKKMKKKVQIASTMPNILPWEEVDNNDINNLKKEKWRLFLSLSPDYRPEWAWKGRGIFYFWIKEEDLQQGNFENVWLIIGNSGKFLKMELNEKIKSF